MLKLSIQTYVDLKSRLLFVHVESIHDMNHMLNTVAKFDQLEENDKVITYYTYLFFCGRYFNQFFSIKSFFEIWERHQIRYIKFLLMLFSSSHIIIVSNFKKEVLYTIS